MVLRRHVLTKAQLGLMISIMVMLAIQGVVPGLSGVLMLNAVSVGLCSVVVALRARQVVGRVRKFWGLLACGMACWATGEVLWQWRNLVSSEAIPFPSPGDVGYLLAIPFMIAALLMASRGRRPRGHRTYLLDLTIMLLGPIVAVWVWAIYPSLHGKTHDAYELSVALAYPLADIAIVILVVRALIINARRNPSLVALVWGMFMFVTADILFAVMIINGWYSNGNPGGALWTLGFMMMALAALHPQASYILEQRASQGDIPSTAILVPMAISAISIPLSALAAWALGIPRHIPSVTLSAITILLLIMTRVALMVRINEKQTRELAAALNDLAAERAARDRLIVETLSALEAERKFVSAELHDGPVQSLSALAYILDAVGKDTDVQQLAATIRGHVGQEIESLRRIMSELRPPALDEQGLNAAVRNLAQEFESSHEVKVTLALDMQERLPETQELVIYRVVQEALVNVAKHARAQQVSICVEMASSDEVSLRIEDDGQGFDPTCAQSSHNGHFGLAVMRERVEIAGGSWQLTSDPDQGTKIVAQIPIPAEANNHG